MAEDLHILIIGAGITGLLIAQGLKLAGIKHTIFESEITQGIRTREWNLGVHNADQDLRSLLPSNLYSRLREAYSDPHHVAGTQEKTPMYNSATGELLHAIPRPDTINVSRKRLRRLCSEGIDVQYGKMFTGASFEEGGVVAHFMGGESVKGDLLVGADGTRSLVREVLLGAEKATRVLCELEVITAIARYRDPEVARRVRSGHPEVCFGYHPEGMFNMIAISNVPNPEDPTTWEFYVANSVLEKSPGNIGNEEIMAQVKSKCQYLAEPFKSSFMEISEDAKLFNDKLYYWAPQPWDNHGGRITLAGDSAHPMPPYRGQGLAQSIRDVANLVKALKSLKESRAKSELPGLIKEYEEEMIKRGGAEVEMSIRSMNMVHDWEKLMQSPLMKIGGQKIYEAPKTE
ncbi:FAD/NAD(P)-binding domain-containing protein [Mollisia scopiformis]|uniref:FAD/NAD(P)-binding domain-containing protein n=1 Tax=Mollisia scopiformis TaxID=149040 RepID=A0A194XFA3_MOLSC|nr:FAD/NAD(P)-binding domain-containing protein [Mollisia scopiformis]KUJ18814.1 FAD/NAD(P)-binding domain-containing protein [Mollisia scopiformis]